MISFSIQFLRALERCVRAACGNEFVAAPLLDDMHAVHHGDPVRVADCGEPVRDDKAGLAFAQDIQAFLDLLLGHAVEG